MFNLFKRMKDVEEYADGAAEAASFCGFRMKALEAYLDIEFFHGDKCKPHYRKKRVVVNKQGRPLKIK